jgi:hypothetical protein
MMENVADAHDVLFSGRLRAMQYLGYVWILFACAVFALLVGKHWAWGPFLLSAAVIAMGGAFNELIARRAMSWFELTEEQRRRVAARQRRRNRVYLTGYGTFAIGFGLVAGSIPSYWVAVVLGGAMLVMTVLVPLAIAPGLKRRAMADRKRPQNTV